MNWRSRILDSNNHPTPALLALLQALNIKHDGTLPSIVAATQTAWLRPAGKERWEIDEKFADRSAQLLPLLEKFEFVQECKPTQQYYDYAIIFGAMVERVRKRVGYLIEQWNVGVRFNKVIVLTGQRPLDPIKEKMDIVPKTETRMLEWIIEQATMPNELRTIITVVDTPMQQTADGLPRRPNTADTITTWLATSPTPGSCLAITTHSFTGYQDAVLHALLPQGFTIETIAPAANGVVISECLDNLARWLYVENQLLVPPVVSERSESNP